MHTNGQFSLTLYSYSHTHSLSLSLSLALCTSGEPKAHFQWPVAGPIF